MPSLCVSTDMEVHPQSMLWLPELVSEVVGRALSRGSSLLCR